MMFGFEEQTDETGQIKIKETKFLLPHLIEFDITYYKSPRTLEFNNMNEERREYLRECIKNLLINREDSKIDHLIEDFIRFN